MSQEYLSNGDDLWQSSFGCWGEVCVVCVWSMYQYGFEWGNYVFAYMDGNEKMHHFCPIMTF